MKRIFAAPLAVLLLIPQHFCLGVIGWTELLTKKTSPNLEISVTRNNDLLYCELPLAHFPNPQSIEDEFWLMICHERLTDKELDFGGHYGPADDALKKVQMRVKIAPTRSHEMTFASSREPSIRFVIEHEIGMRTYLVRNLKPGWHNVVRVVIDLPSFLEAAGGSVSRPQDVGPDTSAEHQPN